MKRRREARHARRPRPREWVPGSLPGALAPKADARPTRVVVRRFGPESFDEAPLARVEELAAVRGGTHCTWIEVTGLADAEIVAGVGRTFGLHELSLEDALDPGQRAKAESYDAYTFIVLPDLVHAERIEARPLSIFFGDGFVLTFQDLESPALRPVRERLRHARGRIRSRGADHLAYALVDSVIDHYFPIVEAFDDYLEQVEDVMLEARDVDPIDLARRARHDLQTIRKTVWPARDAVAALLGDDTERVSEDTRVHLRDCYDHLIQLQEMIEASREIAASLLESYLSGVSLRTNEIMRVLAVIGTIFLPLTFIVGLYGMNFDPGSSPLNMPELRWYWGYPFSLVLMLGTVAGSLLYFRAKGWFGGSPRGASAEHEPGQALQAADPPSPNARR